MGRAFQSATPSARHYKRPFEHFGHYVASPFDNTAVSQYFHIRFFKKGTVHLSWRHEHLWQEFNVTAAKGKRWLGLGGEPEPSPTPPPSDAPIWQAPATSVTPQPTPAEDGLALLQAALQELPLFCIE